MGQRQLSLEYSYLTLTDGELAEFRMSIRVLVADDHEVVRAGLRSLLHGTEIKIVGEAATGEAVLRLTKKHNPDVVLLDIQMPDKDGLWALGRLKVDFPELPVLILRRSTTRPLSLGPSLWAHGYVLKSATKEKLVDAIRSAAAGQKTWTREELRRVTGASATPRLTADVEVPSTQRESEVLKQLALGLTNKEIAHARNQLRDRQGTRATHPSQARRRRSHASRRLGGAKRLRLRNLVTVRRDPSLRSKDQFMDSVCEPEAAVEQRGAIFSSIGSLSKASSTILPGCSPGWRPLWPPVIATRSTVRLIV